MRLCVATSRSDSFKTPKPPPCIELITARLIFLDFNTPLWISLRPIHSFSCRPHFCSSPMLPYHGTLPLLVHALGALSLSIDPPSTNFAVQYNNLFNYTSPINQTNRSHDIECQYVSGPDLPAPDIEVCREVIVAACYKLSPWFPFRIKRNEWVWTSLEGCSLAYYMPEQAPRSQFPSVNECKEQIYGAIIEKCTPMTGRYNVGSINVFVPPDPHGTGSPMLFGYPRYLIASKELDE